MPHFLQVEFHHGEDVLAWSLSLVVVLAVTTGIGPVRPHPVAPYSRRRGHGPCVVGDLLYRLGAEGVLKRADVPKKPWPIIFSCRKQGIPVRVLARACYSYSARLALKVDCWPTAGHVISWRWLNLPIRVQTPWANIITPEVVDGHPCREPGALKR